MPKTICFNYRRIEKPSRGFPKGLVTFGIICVSEGNGSPWFGYEHKETEIVRTQGGLQVLAARGYIFYRNPTKRLYPAFSIILVCYMRDVTVLPDGRGAVTKLPRRAEAWELSQFESSHALVQGLAGDAQRFGRLGTMPLELLQGFYEEFLLNILECNALGRKMFNEMCCLIACGKLGLADIVGQILERNRVVTAQYNDSGYGVA
jgi:hypothetical protein